MKLNDERNKIESKNLKYAHLVKFVDDDIIKNHLPNMQLRCTHLSYIIGNLSVNGKVFTDIMHDDNRYLYFKSVTDAIYSFGDDTVQVPFVLKANPIEYLGIKENLTKEELKERLKKIGMYFNFTDDEKSLVKKIKY